MNDHAPPIVEHALRGGVPWRKLSFALALAACAAGLMVAFRDEMSLVALAEHEAEWRAWYREHPLTMLTLGFAIYFLATSLSVPTVWPLSVAYGWIFGFWPALVIVSFASTAGATVALLMSRYLLREYVQQRFGGRWLAVRRGLEREGATYLLTLRLIPVVPFFLVNWLMGVTALRVRTFWWVSQVGMIPATCLYVWAGTSVPTLAELERDGVAGLFSWKLGVAMLMLALFPLFVRQAVKCWRSRNAAPA